MNRLVTAVILFLLLMNPRARASTDLVFKENKNQWDKCVLFATELQSGSVFLSRDSFTFLMADTNDLNRVRHTHHPWMYNPHLDLSVRVHIFRQIFDNSNAGCKVKGEEPLKEYFNFYLGKDPSKWASNVQGYNSVDYENLYDNIDLEVTSQDVNMKYDFVVKNGGDPAQIKMHYVGIDDVQLVNGDLVLKTSIGAVTDTRPYAYQLINGEKKQVNCAFRLQDGSVSFDFPDGYDKNAELIIDPTLVFSTYSGSHADNFGYSATYDSKGNAYAAGSIFQFIGKYPTTTGAFQTSWAGGVGFGLSGQYDGTG
ncbi:MAG: hypothetical protein ACHP6H_05910, partial [Legionellales bacterium]